MSLLTPDSGLLFWMILSFGIVLFLLSKFAFPIIVKAIEERKEYLDNSLEVAKQANARLANIQAEGEKMLADAKARQNEIIKEALAEKERIIEDAHQKASDNTRKQIEEATKRIRDEKERAIREIKTELTDLSISIAEKVIKEKIGHGDEQQQIIDKLLDQMTFSKS